MQDCFAQFVEDENTDLFAQSPEHQRAPFANAVDGPSAEDALFDRFQQGESAWLSTCCGVPSALDSVTDFPERAHLICPLGSTDLQSLLKCMTGLSAFGSAVQYAFHQVHQLLQCPAGFQILLGWTQSSNKGDLWIWSPDFFKCVTRVMIYLGSLHGNPPDQMLSWTDYL